MGTFLSVAGTSSAATSTLEISSGFDSCDGISTVSTSCSESAIGLATDLGFFFLFLEQSPLTLAEKPAFEECIILKLAWDADERET